MQDLTVKAPQDPKYIDNKSLDSNRIMHATINVLADHLRNMSESIDDETMDEFANLLNSANRIFVMGAGRSGLVAKSFAMRLMHIGYQVYVVGEIITPAVSAGDVVIAISGSGNTRTISEFGEICKKLNVKVITVTSNRESVLGRMSDLVVLVDSNSRRTNETEYMERQLSGDHKSLTPLGTVFELTTAVFLDSFIAKLMIVKGVDESHLKMRHTVLE
ncbi:6-phospho-3-hexuloisomerase [Methanocella sp. CWC-04]|uniref:6-phospho-3-hexuloisomerase n=2 Tax=Methanooceanicella nereidis TaxID=2052831 RepID=A0AAP2RF96_9EURY|nr:6-phospho-3-hexuloisomerase [Methanocella sp. CWC-04]